jgi:branched-chain amino acid transport system substrate-binding protein
MRTIWAAVAVVLVVGGTAGADVSSGADKGKATGEPIVLGLINTEGNPILDFTEFRLAAEAAGDYVNEELGGIGGRPVEFVTCATNLSAEASTKCVNQILEADPLAVIGGVDVATSATMPLWEQAGVAYIGAPAFQEPEQVSPNSFALASWSAGGFSSLSDYAANELDAKSVRVIAVDLPANRFQFENFIAPVLEANGVTDAELVTQPLSATDWTATWSAVQQDDPDAVIAIAGQGQCQPIFQARASLGITIPLLTTGACADQVELEAIGTDAAEGTYFEFNFLAPLVNNKQVKTFKRELKQHADGDVPVTSFSQAGFGAVMTTRDVLKNLDAASLSREGILDAFREVRDGSNYLGAPITCDGEQVPGFPSYCTSAVRLAQLRKGKLVELTKGWVDTTNLFEGS